jgi:hypothetical protein
VTLTKKVRALISKNQSTAFFEYNAGHEGFSTEGLNAVVAFFVSRPDSSDPFCSNVSLLWQWIKDSAYCLDAEGRRSVVGRNAEFCALKGAEE